MNKKIFLSMLIAGVATLGVNAQQQQGKELSKEITLEKDFVPVVKKVTKKNTLPKVKKIAAPAKTDLKYSETPVNIEVPTTIPTMMPYGYRTAHNFSDKRGYLEVGGGMAANFDGSAGYRFVDSDNTQAGIWVQHNSTWADKNKTPLITDDAQRAKQVFNDNRAGLYLTNHFGDMGVLKLDAGVHFDSFNYYGTRKVETPNFDADRKQTFVEGGLNGKWNGKLNFKDNEVDYRLNVGFNHAGYDIIPTHLVDKGKPANENIFNFGIGGSYNLENYGLVSLDLKGDYVSFKGYSGNPKDFYPQDKNYFILTIAPRYKWENDIFRAEAGVDLYFGDLQIQDEIARTKHTGKLHIAPVAKIDVDLTDGAALFADVKGGNCINSLSHMASLDRYSVPTGVYSNTWTQLDGEVGFKFGPFQGFNAKIFAGYAITEGAMIYENELWDPAAPEFHHAANQYRGCKLNGAKFGAELNYKYRSLVDVAGRITIAPGKEFDNYGIENSTLKGYSLGLDGACMVANLDVKAHPISKLTVGLGMDYRGQRKHLLNATLEDFINVYANANWRFNKTVSVWVKGNNLINRKQDVMLGQGAQGINAMGGVSLVF